MNRTSVVSRGLAVWRALLVGVVVLAAGCGSSGSSGSDDPQTAPDFVLTGLDGHAVRLSDYRGKVVLIDFWATWCGPCRVQIPQLIDLYAEYNPRGFEIIGVAVNDREDLVRRFAASLDINYVTCIGNPGVVEAYGNFTAIPTAFLIGRDGRIAARYTGLHEKDVLEEAVQRLLGEEIGGSGGAGRELAGR